MSYSVKNVFSTRVFQIEGMVNKADFLESSILGWGKKKWLLLRSSQSFQHSSILPLVNIKNSTPPWQTCLLTLDPDSRDRSIWTGWPDISALTGEHGQEREDGPGQNSNNRTAASGELWTRLLGRTAGAGQMWQDSQDRGARTGYSRERTARTGQPEKTVGKVHSGRKEITGLLEHDSKHRADAQKQPWWVNFRAGTSGTAPWEQDH